MNMVTFLTFLIGLIFILEVRAGPQYGYNGGAIGVSSYGGIQGGSYGGVTSSLGNIEEDRSSGVYGAGTNGLNPRISSDSRGFGGVTADGRSYGRRWIGKREVDSDTSLILRNSILRNL